MTIDDLKSFMEKNNLPDPDLFGEAYLEGYLSSPEKSVTPKQKAANEYANQVFPEAAKYSRSIPAKFENKFEKRYTSLLNQAQRSASMKARAICFPEQFGQPLEIDKKPTSSITPKEDELEKNMQLLRQAKLTDAARKSVLQSSSSVEEIKTPTQLDDNKSGPRKKTYKTKKAYRPANELYSEAAELVANTKSLLPKDNVCDILLNVSRSYTTTIRKNLDHIYEFIELDEGFSVRKRPEQPKEKPKETDEVRVYMIKKIMSSEKLSAEEKLEILMDNYL